MSPRIFRHVFALLRHQSFLVSSVGHADTNGFSRNAVYNAFAIKSVNVWAFTETGGVLLTGYKEVHVKITGT